MPPPTTTTSAVAGRAVGPASDRDRSGNALEVRNDLGRARHLGVATVHVAQGEAVVFPGDRFHRGEDITRGERLLLVGFLDDG